MPEAQVFFVRGEDGEEYGPVGLAEMRSWVTENRVGLGTNVRLDAPGELWQPWQYHPELVALLAEARTIGPMSDGLAPAIAPLGRRVTAAILDLILCYFATAPLLAVVFFLLPADVIVQIYSYGWSILQNVTPAPVAPAIPLWFSIASNLVWFGLPVLYHAGFTAAHGRTPGKSILRLRVVDAQGGKPVLTKTFLRALVLVASVYIFYGIPLIYALLNPQRRTLHDLVAGTYVVER